MGGHTKARGDDRCFVKIINGGRRSWSVKHPKRLRTVLQLTITSQSVTTTPNWPRMSEVVILSKGNLHCHSWVSNPHHQGRTLCLEANVVNPCPCCLQVIRSLRLYVLGRYATSICPQVCPKSHKFKLMTSSPKLQFKETPWCQQLLKPNTDRACVNVVLVDHNLLYKQQLGRFLLGLTYSIVIFPKHPFSGIPSPKCIKILRKYSCVFICISYNFITNHFTVYDTK